jgi:hypothetical protein
MPFTSVPLIAQVVKDESELAAKPYYVSADKMRSVAGKMETIYAHELFSSTALTGVARGGIIWADLARTAWAAFGTHLRIQVYDQDGSQTDITPVVERGRLTNPFTVSSGSTTITVSDDSHGLIADQLVNFGTSSAANVPLSGNYTVSSVVSSSTYTFIATSTANTSTALVGGTIDYEYRLAPGNLNGLGGLGYGTGPFGTGGYSSPSTSASLDPRTVSFAVWGQNLIVNPNWGGIYEWAPNTSASELLTNGDFSTSSAWTAGSGWTVSSGVATASSANGSLSQSVSTLRSAWHLLKYDLTLSSGAVTPLLGTSTINAAISSANTYKHTFFSPVSSAQTLTFSGNNFSGTLDNVSLKVLTTANLIPNAPAYAGSVFVTAERNLVACGTVNLNNSVLDPMRVQWSGQENNNLWIPAASNLAGGYTLSHGSRIVRGLPGNRENLIFTDTAVYRMRAVPDPSVVYAFDLLGEGCGLIGPNAVVQANGMFFWVSPQGKFYIYAGGAPIPIPNPSERDFRDNLADVQGAKIHAAHLSSRSEIWFFYPDERDGIECSRYHVYNYLDKTWVSGNYDRTTYVDAGVLPFPLATDSSGNVYFQEKDFSNDGSARSTSLETSYFNIGDGETFAYIKDIRPDFDDLRGGATITFTSRNYPQGAERTYGPYSITPTTRRLSVRIKGRQIKYRINTNDAPSFYRVGAMTFDVQKSGQKK